MNENVSFQKKKKNVKKKKRPCKNKSKQIHNGQMFWKFKTIKKTVTKKNPIKI